MIDLEKYAYDLPEEQIAKAPAEPGDSSRLLVYDVEKNQVTTDTFLNLAKHLSKDTLLVFNDTKVVPARCLLRKDTGGKREMLFLVNEYRPGDATIRAIAQKKLLVARKLFIDNDHGFEIVGQHEYIFELKPLFPIEKLPELLLKYGKTPIPHYIEHTHEESRLRDVYQSIFAREAASVAAPTASLHFTERVFDSLAKKGIEHCFVTLHIGLGTFMPLRPEHFSEGKLHREYYEIPKSTAEKIALAKKTGKKVIAVGTTAARALESRGEKGFTDIFIRPPYEFKVIDGLITNFHLPKSSLMCLVDAFLEYKRSQQSLTSLYKGAIKEKMRFYSFGDGMLIT